MSRKRDLLLAPLGEAGLILALGLIGWAASWPFLFASLGPNAYEMVEKPESKSAKPYSIIAGQFVALGCGFFSLWIFHAWSSPKVLTAGFVAAPRMWAAATAVALSVAVALAIDASQPASMSTALLISLGAMQTARDALAIAIGVLLLVAIGEPVRRLREKSGQRGKRPGDLPYLQTGAQ
jgi:hypothetical protein